MAEYNVYSMMDKDLERKFLCLLVIKMINGLMLKVCVNCWKAIRIIMISNQERRVLITGASGLLGGNILNLLPKSWNVVGVVNKHGLAPINKK